LGTILAGAFKGGLFSIYGVAIAILVVYSSTLSQQSRQIKEVRPRAKK
jgi:hypothetical protein